MTPSHLLLSLCVLLASCISLHGFTIGSVSHVGSSTALFSEPRQPRRNLKKVCPGSCCVVLHLNNEKVSYSHAYYINSCCGTFTCREERATAAKSKSERRTLKASSRGKPRKADHLCLLQLSKLAKIIGSMRRISKQHDQESKPSRTA